VLIPRARRVLLFLSLATALGAAGCTSTVVGSAVRATGSPTAAAVNAAAAPVGRNCPSAATLRGALPHDGASGTYTLSGPVLCSGDYAVANPLYTAADPQGDGRPVSVTQLFHRVGDGWQAVDREPLCAAGTVPRSIYQLTCQSN
jgi:hypothetical protein